MAEAKNTLLLVGDALIYFVLLAGLFRARRRIGLGAFFCALGVMHFLETYLASTVYVLLPFGIVASPGSAVLFTGKLMLLLVVYIREDAVVVRQPIYGLLLGNVLLIALAAVIGQHDLQSYSPARTADFGLIDEMGALMVWGTAVLFVDCIAIILIYERSRLLLGGRVVARLALSGALVLSFDQAAFFAGLHWLTGAPLSVLLGGWIAKMGAVAVYSVLAGIYLHWLEQPRANAKAPRLSDVFDRLTYRERYEDLLARTGRDALTGAFDRGRLEQQGRRCVADAARSGRPVSLFIVDIDDFKGFNDRFGHAAGDAVLTRIGRLLMLEAGPAHAVYRYGGEEFVIIADTLASAAALDVAERIRAAVARRGDAGAPRVTVSIGLATSADADAYDDLFAVADDRLYRAKSAGRNRVVGAPEPVRLAFAG